MVLVRSFLDRHPSRPDARADIRGIRRMVPLRAAMCDP
jgi:hypothetical protein